MQYLCALFVTPAVNIKAQQFVRFNSVRAFILQSVSANLVDDAYAAPFLLLINDCAVSFGCYKPHGLMKLLAAIAPDRAKHISRHTLRMNADEARAIEARNIFDQRDELFV